jgi:hypothetical protein
MPFRLDQRVIKGSGGYRRLVCNLDDDASRFFIPGGLMFLKATQGM